MPGPTETPPTVGVSTHEAVLTAAVIERPQDVFSAPSDEHALVVLAEVELGVGRPDIIVLAADVRALSLRRSAGLRLHNLTEARALGAAWADDPASAGMSRDHYRRLSTRLAELGWLDGVGASHVIHDSLLIEAKVSHWGRGLQQLARVRWASHTAALLVPDNVATQVPRAMLRHNQLGLLTQEDGRVAWRRTSPRAVLPLHIDAWLGELAVRTLAD